jgi:5-methylcytosine-specific restriction enzyme A
MHMKPRLKCLPPLLKTVGHAPKKAGWLAQHTTSRHARGYGWAWEQAVKRIRARDCDLCQQCVREATGHIGTYSAVDHVVPRVEGGGDHDGNLEVICKDHHDAKTAAESRRARGLE